MVFNITSIRACIRCAKNIAITLMLLSATGSTFANSKYEVIHNTVSLTVLENGELENSGVALVIGSYDGKALLLMPAHLLPSIGELGNADSLYDIVITTKNAATISVSYSKCRSFLSGSDFENAIINDYIYIEMPVTKIEKTLFNNLNKTAFSAPSNNLSINMFFVNTDASLGFNYGTILNVSSGRVKKFKIEVENLINKGESGAIVMGSDDVLKGILISSDSSRAYAVFPEPGLYDALKTISNAKSNRSDSYGMSLSVIPTYQNSRENIDLGNGVNQESITEGSYAAIEFEYFSLTTPASSTKADKVGLVLGYSGGDGHGIGQVNNADFTLKIGGVIGSVDRYENDLTQIGLFVLAHKVNDAFSFRLGGSLEQTWSVIDNKNHKLDLGGRLELNRVDFVAGDISFGVGLVVRYFWDNN